MSRQNNTLTPAKNVEPGAIPPNRVGGVYLVVYGQCVSLKNRRRLLRNRRTGQPIFGKSKDAERYVQDFCRQVPMWCRNRKLGDLDRPLRLIVTAYYVSRRSDLDMGIVMDSLQISGVIRNDRDIIEQHLYALVDRKNPRCEITVEEI